MKKTIKLFSVIAVALGVIAACDPNTPTDQPASAVALSISGQAITNQFTDLASSGVAPITVDVTADGEWIVSESLDWVSVDPVTGTGDGSFTITVADNFVDSVEQAPRAGVISVGSELKTVKIAINQKGDNKVTLPYSIDFREGQSIWTTENVKIDSALSYIWKQDGSYGMKASAYSGSANYASDSYLISPVFDLTGETAAIASMHHAANKGNVSDVSVVVREVNGDVKGEWSKPVEGITWPAGTDWQFIPSGEFDLSAYCGKKIQLGFRYTSTAQSSVTWEIKDFTMDNVSVAKFSVATDTVCVKASAISTSFTVKGNVVWTVVCDPATMTASPDSAKGEKNVTLSFPANESTTDTVNYTVTVSTEDAEIETKSYSFVVSQAPKSTAVNTIAEVLAATEVNSFNVNNAGVMAIQDRNVILSDPTGCILMYKADHGLAVGDVINIKDGTIKQYQGVWEFDSPTIEKIDSTFVPDYGTPVELTTDSAIVAFTNPESYRYVHFVGTVKTDNKNRTFLTVGGSKGIYLAVASAGWDGKVVDIWGYAVGEVSTYGTITTILHKIEEVKSDKNLSVSENTFTVAGDSTSVQFTVNANVAWTATCDSACVTLSPSSGSDTTAVTVTFPENTSDTTKVFTITVSTEEDVFVKTHTVTVKQTSKSIAYSTIGDIMTKGAGTYSVKDAVVMAVAGSNVIIGDATGRIMIYKSGHGLALGEVITLTDQVVSARNGLYQFGASDLAWTKAAEKVTPDYGTPVELATDQDIVDYQANTQYEYIHVRGVMGTDNRTVKINQKGVYIYTVTGYAGKTVDVYGFANGKASSYGTITTTLVKIEQYQPAKVFDLSEDKISVDAKDTVATFTVNAKNVSWKIESETAVVNPTSGSDTTEVSVSFPANADSTAKEYVINVIPSDKDFDTLKFTVSQAKAGVAVKTIVIDGSVLTTTATTAVESYTFNKNFSVKMGIGVKSQSNNNAKNHFGDNTCILLPDGKEIYNTTAVPGKITKFEVYANFGASASAAVTVGFDTKEMTSLPTEGTWAQALSTLDYVYECPAANIPAGATYFYLKNTSTKKDQIQIRITYETE